MESIINNSETIALYVFALICAAGIVMLIVYKLEMKKMKKDNSKHEAFIEIQLYINKVHNDETQRIATRLITWFINVHGEGAESHKLKTQLQRRSKLIDNVPVFC